MPLKVWNGSSWIEATGLKAWNGSTWASANQASVWNGSTWVQFYSGVLITLNDTYSVTSVGAAQQTAGFTLRTDGDISTSTTPGGSVVIGSWTTQSASDFEAYAQVISGVTPSGPLDQWWNLGDENTSWFVSYTSATPGTRTSQIFIQIRPAGGGAVLDDTTVTLTAQRT